MCRSLRICWASASVVACRTLGQSVCGDCITMVCMASSIRRCKPVSSESHAFLGMSDFILCGGGYSAHINKGSQSRRSTGCKGSAKLVESLERGPKESNPHLSCRPRRNEPWFIGVFTTVPGLMCDDTITMGTRGPNCLKLTPCSGAPL